MTPNRKPYLSYLRVSSDDQRERETIQNQEQQHRLWYARNEIDPETQVHWVYDDGISGRIRIWKRPGGRQLEELIEGNLVTEAVIITKVNRANRDDVASWFLLTGLCEEYDLKVLTIQDGVDTSTEAGYMIGGLNAMYARSTKRQQLQDMRDGKARGAKKGIWQGSHTKKPYGFRVNAESRLEIEPSEQATLYRIRDLLRQGDSIRKACNTLNAENVATPQGAQRWVHCTLIRVMANPALKGKARFNHTKSQVQKGTKKVIARSEAEHIYIECPAIFPEEEFNRIQEWLVRNRAKYHADGSFRNWVFVNSIQCAHCGGKYYPFVKRGAKPTHADWVYYRHAWHSDKLKACPYVKKTINAKWVEPLVWDEVLKAVNDTDTWEASVSATAPAEDFTPHLTALRATIDDINASLDELEDTYFIRKRITPERYDHLQGKLTSRLESARKTLALTEARAAALNDSTHRVQTLAATIRRLKNGITEDAPIEQKRRVCDAVIEVVEVHHSPSLKFRLKWRV